MEFREHGAMLLSAVIPKERVLAMREAFYQRCSMYMEDKPHADALKVGHRRFMITPEFAPPFADPEVYASTGILRLMRSLLSDECILGSFGAVVSLPGAEAQHVHRDFGGLFPEVGLDAMLPPYAITAVVPLIDVDEVTGTTVVWPGSHRQRTPANDYEPAQALWPKMCAGDVLLMDYRLVHGGSANVSTAPRPILYMVYYRPWFRDHVNYSVQERLRISRDMLEALPREHRRLIAESP